MLNNKLKNLTKINIEKKMLIHKLLQMKKMVLNLRMTKMKIFHIKQKEIKILIVLACLLSSKKK